MPPKRPFGFAEYQTLKALNTLGARDGRDGCLFREPADGSNRMASHHVWAARQEISLVTRGSSALSPAIDFLPDTPG